MSISPVLNFTNETAPTDYVILNPFSSFPDTAMTIELWLKTSVANQGTPISYEAPGTTNTFLLFRCTTNLEVFVNGATSNTNISFNDGQWHHCAVTWESNTGKLEVYKDGKQAFTSTISQGKTINRDGALVLGQEQDSVGGGFDVNQAFRGQLSEVRIWNRVRTAEEIEANMNLRLVGNEPATQSFNQDTGLADYSYWYQWKRSLPQDKEKKPFRRGRIWS